MRLRSGRDADYSGRGVLGRIHFCIVVATQLQHGSLNAQENSASDKSS